jgi:hypothetical protein
VADEIVVDLMKESGGIGYREASSCIEWATVEGVQIPFASAGLLWKLKQAPRAKDEVDRSFLRALLGVTRRVEAGDWLRDFPGYLLVGCALS